jgi:hypothetical protein
VQTTLTLLQRINIQNVLRDHKAAPFTDDWDLETTIWKKVRFTPEEKESLEQPIQTPQGEVRAITMAKVEELGETTVQIDLNYAEAGKIITLFKTGKYSAADCTWLSPLKEELDKVTKEEKNLTQKQ